jgi:hypothetical protein
MSEVLAQLFEEGVPHFSLGRLRPVLDLGQQLRFDPDALVSDLLRERLRLPNQRRQTLLQVGRRDLVEAVVDLPCVDEFVALPTADVEAVPLGIIKREAGDRTR